MSAVANKQEKVTLEESKAAKIGFENAPKLFSKWGYDEIKVCLKLVRLEIPASSTTSPPPPPRLKSLCLTLPADIKAKSSEKLSAPSSSDWLALCSSTAETPVRR